MKPLYVLLLLICLLLIPAAAAAEESPTDGVSDVDTIDEYHNQASVDREITGSVQSCWVSLDVQNGLTFGDLATGFQNYLDDVWVTVETNMHEGWDLEITVRDQRQGSGRGHMRLETADLVDANQYLTEPLYVTGPALGGEYQSLESTVSIVDEENIIGRTYSTQDIRFRQEVTTQDEAGDYKITVRFTAIVGT